MTHILLTNDDGIHAAGLKALAAGLAGFATISVVAPHREQSGAAQSLTLRQPIICNQVGEREWSVEGTPADAVIVALHRLLPEPPDLVISGINFGANLGENVYYSGTVGAAREAALHHIPAIAMSLCSKAPGVKFEPAGFKATQPIDIARLLGWRSVGNEVRKASERISAPLESQALHASFIPRRLQIARGPLNS